MSKTKFEWLCKGTSKDEGMFSSMVHDANTELWASDGRQLRWMDKPSLPLPDVNAVRAFIKRDAEKASFMSNGDTMVMACKAALAWCKAQGQPSDRSGAKLVLNGNAEYNGLHVGNDVTSSDGEVHFTWVNPAILLTLFAKGDKFTLAIRGPFDPLHISYTDGRQAIVMPVRGYDDN